LGALIFDPQTLTDTLSETAGYKSGIALSVPEMCDHLAGTEYPDILRASEQHAVRLRSEEYAGLYYKLLHRIGYTAEEYDGDTSGAKLYHKYKDTALVQCAGVTELFVEIWPELIEATVAAGSKAIDPRPFIQAAFDKYGRIGLDMAIERLDVLDRGLHLNPHGGLRYVEWKNEIALASLFAGTKEAPQIGRFFDQRYIDYLSVNHNRLSDMHWRKFEELTGEFFHREGYQVELGPGSNDDGVDVRVWRPEQMVEESPHILVQCKRQKAKVEKVVVKGLHADVSYESADYGLIVTTSELSPGARATIEARGYPIQEVDRSGLEKWLQTLRTPGTGIVRV
jgi:restriction system protein